MIVARVKGNVVSTNKSEKMMGMKLLIVQKIDIETQQETNNTMVAVDTVGAGVGETVMCVTGSSSRQTAVTEAKPVDVAIIGIIDSIELMGELVFEKYKS